MRQTIIALVFSLCAVACTASTEPSSSSCGPNPSPATSSEHVLKFDDELAARDTGFSKHACAAGELAIVGACACNGCTLDDSLPVGADAWTCIATPDPNAVQAWVHLELTCAASR